MFIDRKISQRPPVITAEVNYLAPISEKPYGYAYPPPDGKPERNYLSEPHPVLIEDLRGIPNEPSLDREGFAVLRHDSAEREFAEEGIAEGPYYSESEALLRDATGAERVFIFGSSTFQVDGAKLSKSAIGAPIR